MDIKEAKKIIEKNAFPESFHGTNLVVDLEAVLSILDDVKSISNPIICDCVIPKPLDAYDNLDKHICRDCNGNINQE